MATDPRLSVVDDSDEEARAQRAASIRRLLARGTDIELANGDTLAVVLTARELATIEAEYGSVLAYMDVLQSAWGGKLYALLGFTLGMLLRKPVDKVWDLIDTRQTREYNDAICAALMEAMPPEEAEGNAEGATTTAPSPGPSSSTSASSTSTSPRPSSGA